MLKKKTLAHYNINLNKCTKKISLVGNIECKNKSYKPKQGGM